MLLIFYFYVFEFSQFYEVCMDRYYYSHCTREEFKAQWLDHIAGSWEGRRWAESVWPIVQTAAQHNVTSNYNFWCLYLYKQSQVQVSMVFTGLFQPGQACIELLETIIIKKYNDHELVVTVWKNFNVFCLQLRISTPSCGKYLLLIFILRMI